MQSLGLNEIREKYLQFFEAKEHLRLPSFSLVPKNDPSILLINAGMTPMKSYFTGAVAPPAKRITSCQKCIRTGDIENVGYTDRHGTYFEMLGNFSFGDYFKEEMIPWIWEFCTQELAMDPDRLYPSVYEEDDEAFAIWNEVVKVPKERIYRFGKEDNFWEHGTGPSGPCTEVYYDRGEEYACGSDTCAPGCECDRFVEFWNSVFTQFDRQEDGSYVPLEQKNIDTGVGLERLATIVQDVGSIFEVDTVRAILDRVSTLANKTYKEDKKTDISIRIITDHIRATVMMIADGITPSNGGRGYVLRRLIRRAIRNGRQLGIVGPFLLDLAEVVISQNENAYPELRERHDFIMSTIQSEERSFDRTLEQGNQILAEEIARAKAEGRATLAAEEVFRLHDTYGFPVDLTKEIALEEGLEIDEAGFHDLMQEQRLRAQENTRQNVKTAWGSLGLPDEVTHLEPSIFTGYETLEEEASLLYLLVSNEEEKTVEIRKELGEGESCILITDRTPFYANAGGQVGDIGYARQNDTLVKINNTTKTSFGVFLHDAIVEQGILTTGASIQLRVDKENRMDTARNHTTTHLLHKALRDILGNHVTQAGSEVSAEHLRFDFSHFSSLSEEELENITAEVNRAILADYPVRTDIMSVQEAKDAGAMALFDEKYGDAVRVLSIGDYSMELCGGTHLHHTSQAGSFRIVSESSIAAGVRRIEAVTGHVANQLAKEDRERISRIAQSLKTQSNGIETRIEQLSNENRNLVRDLQQLQQAATRAQNANIIDQAEEVSGVKVLVAKVDTADANAMRELGDDIKSKLESVVLVLAREDEGKVNFLVMVSKDVVAKGMHAGNIVKEAAKLAGGGGGGRPDMAQAGGKDVSKIDEALAKAKEMILTILQ